MSTNRYATLVGLALGAILALSESLGLTIVAAIFAAVGYLVGLVLEGRIDINTRDFTASRREPPRTS